MDPFSKLNKIKSQQLQKFDFKEDARRKRGTKEWKSNREEFLKDKNKCAWCGQETNDFDVHHTWSQSFSRQWMKATDDAFVESLEYSTELTKDRNECPNCHKRDYYERKTKNPTYRCNNCKEEFSEPLTVEGGQAIKSDEYGNKAYATSEYYDQKAEWVESNKQSVKEKFKIRYQSLMDDYAELRDDQVVAICSKCHYKEEKTPKKRCPNCGSNWYNPKKFSDSMCWECIVDEKGLEKCPECGDNWFQPNKYDSCNECR